MEQEKNLSTGSAENQEQVATPVTETAATTREHERAEDLSMHLHPQHQELRNVLLEAIHKVNGMIDQMDETAKINMGVTIVGSFEYPDVPEAKGFGSANTTFVVGTALNIAECIDNVMDGRPTLSMALHMVRASRSEDRQD